VSHDATAWARLQKTGSTTAKFILYRLADYAGTDYSCYPSVKKLAEDCEMGESTVRAATKLLAELGLIKVFYRYRDNRTRRSSRYQLLVDGPDTMEPDAEDWADHRQISADGHRQEPAGTPQEPADGHRQEPALIPLMDPSLREPSPVIPGASRTQRATRLPEDFQPDESMRAWFVAEKLGDVINGRWEHDKFVDYWLGAPGAKGKKLNWPRTWRNWMRSAAERAYKAPGQAPGSAPSPVSGAPYRPSTTDQRVAQGLSLAAKYEEQGL
jgi:DNA-binding transcriptional ArsR family regulator